MSKKYPEASPWSASEVADLSDGYELKIHQQQQEIERLKVERDALKAVQMDALVCIEDLQSKLDIQQVEIDRRREDAERWRKHETRIIEAYDNMQNESDNAELHAAIDAMKEG